MDPVQNYFISNNADTDGLMHDSCIATVFAAIGDSVLY